jgi:hypothetical protein
VAGADAITREELLALAPDELLSGGLTPPLAGRLRAEAPLALAEQLRADGVPPEALAMWTTLLHVAFEAPLTGESLARLRQNLLRDARTPRFAAWARALGARLVDRASIEAAIELVFLAYRRHLVIDTLRKAD